MKKQLSKTRKIGLTVAALAVIALLFIYFLALAPNFGVKRYVYVYVDNRHSYKNLCEQIQDSAHCRNMATFRFLASAFRYPGKMKAGRYIVRKGMGNLTLLRNLRNGNQEPVHLTFNNIRFKTDLAERLSQQLMCSKDEILKRLNDTLYCDSLGFKPETVIAMFIPNTYDIYWNISPDKLMKRMKHEYDNFWNDKRKAQAQQIGLSPVEVATLASIVEEETASKDEYPLVAGVYINRLHIGMPLQSDPTVKFAVGDFSLHRILFEHLSVDSPYNTYKYVGLPPGPLRVPSIQGMEAVLNYTHHNYIYMCAKEDFSGRHNYAATLNEHVRNANRYRAALDARNIR